MEEKEIYLQKIQFRIDALFTSIEKIALQLESTGIGDWISEESTRKLTGLGKTTLYNLRRSGEILSSSLTPKTIMYSKKSLLRLIEKRAKS